MCPDVENASARLIFEQKCATVVEFTGPNAKNSSARCIFGVEVCNCRRFQTSKRAKLERQALSCAKMCNRLRLCESEGPNLKRQLNFDQVRTATRALSPSLNEKQQTLSILSARTFRMQRPSSALKRKRATLSDLDSAQTHFLRPHGGHRSLVQHNRLVSKTRPSLSLNPKPYARDIFGAVRGNLCWKTVGI